MALVLTAVRRTVTCGTCVDCCTLHSHVWHVCWLLSATLSRMALVLALVRLVMYDTLWWLLSATLSLMSRCVDCCPPRCHVRCRWQVTAKHTCTLRIWLCMKWHGPWLYGVHKTCAQTAGVSCGTSHASAVSTPLRWIFKNALYKKLFTHVESHARAMSLLEGGE